MNRNIIFNIRIILFVMLFCGISLACYSNNSIAVGIFRLTPCPDNPSAYSISMNKDTVVGNGHETLRIPSKIQANGKTYNIVQIASRGFVNCCFIEKLVIDEGITAVGGYAFYGCSSLQAVSFPSTFSSLGGCAFFDCPELKIIDVDKANPEFDSREHCNAVVRTADDAIELGCAGTTFPRSVSTICKHAFHGCTGLVSVSIPQWIEKIDDYAFSACFRLEKINLPENCTLQFGQSAFDYCISLTSFYLPAGDFYFCENPFTNCENLSFFTVSPSNKKARTNKENNAIVSVEDSTLLAGCYNTTIGNDIKRIYASAFKGCRRLARIYIPASVERVDAGAFSGCSNLVDVVVDKANKIYDSRDDCNCIIESKSDKIVCGSSMAIIPKSVHTVGKYAFQGMNLPTVFRIPDNILKVEEYAFAECNNLFRLVVPANTELKNRSFYGCASLTNVFYEHQNRFMKPRRNLTFDWSPYLGCPRLMSVSISGENVPVIEDGYLVGCEKR